MKLPTFIRRILGQERRTITDPNNWLTRGITQTAGVPVSDQTMFGASTVYACCRLVAETIASFPLNVYERMPNGGKRIAKEHPLQRLLEIEPNPNMTPQILLENFLLQRYGWGNAYLFVEWDKRGQIEAIWPLQSGATSVMMATGPQDDPLGYFYTTTLSKNPLIPLPLRALPTEIIHVPLFPTNHAWIGWSESINRIAGGPIGIALAMDMHVGSFYRNGATLGGFFQTDKAIDDETRKKFEAYLSRSQAGPYNAYKPFIGPNGLKYEKTTSSLQESQSVEHRSFQVEDVCRLFGVPPHLVSASKTVQRGSVEQQSLEFAEYTLRPICILLEHEINRKCFVGDEIERFFTEFQMDALLRSDYATRQQGLAVQRQNGIITANEWRREEGKNPSDEPDADKLFILSNMGAAGGAIQLPASNLQAQKQQKQKQNQAEEDPIEENRSLFWPIFEDLAEKIVARDVRHFGEASKRMENRTDLEAFYRDLKPTALSSFLSVLIDSYLKIGKDSRSSGNIEVTVQSEYEKAFRAQSAKAILTGEYDVETAKRDLITAIRRVLEERGVIGYHKYPLADEGQAWDVGAATKDSDSADLKKQCAWFDSSAPDLKGSYKLAHHLGKADGYKTVWKGVAAAMAALGGAHGNKPDIPAGDVAGVRKHLEAHYRDFGKDIPE